VPLKLFPKSTTVLLREEKKVRENLKTYTLQELHEFGKSSEYRIGTLYKKLNKEELVNYLARRFVRGQVYFSQGNYTKKELGMHNEWLEGERELVKVVDARTGEIIYRGKPVKYKMTCRLNPKIEWKRLSEIELPIRPTETIFRKVLESEGYIHRYQQMWPEYSVKDLGGKYLLVIYMDLCRLKNDPNPYPIKPKKKPERFLKTPEIVGKRTGEIEYRGKPIQYNVTMKINPDESWKKFMVTLPVRPTRAIYERILESEGHKHRPKQMWPEYDVKDLGEGNFLLTIHIEPFLYKWVYNFISS
jgi:hypothetical protein